MFMRSFQPIPHQRLPPNYASSHLLGTEGVPPNTPILEISSKIHPHPSNISFKITTRHHSDALATHPLLRLMHSTNTPNCHLEAILIPEPSPHLKQGLHILAPGYRKRKKKVALALG